MGFWKAIQAKGIVAIQMWKFGIPYSTWGNGNRCDESPGSLGGFMGDEGENGIG